MKARTTTISQSIFTRPPPASVTYDLTSPNSTLITVPPSSLWTTGPHWHETHTEHLAIVSGAALITLRNSTWIHTPADGTITIPRYAVHEWRRAPDADPESEAEDLVVREWTDPADGQKEVFFRMLNSFLVEPAPEGLHSTPCLRWVVERVVVPLQVWVVFAAWDNWPVLVGRGWIGWVITHVVLRVASVLGGLVGLRSVYGEYVNEELMRGVEEEKKKKKR